MLVAKSEPAHRYGGKEECHLAKPSCPEGHHAPETCLRCLDFTDNATNKVPNHRKGRTKKKVVSVSKKKKNCMNSAPEFGNFRSPDHQTRSSPLLLLIKRLPAWSQSLILLCCPLSPLEWFGGCNWLSLLRWKQTSCLGTQNRLSVCLHQRKVKRTCRFKHTHAHTALFNHPPSPNNYCHYLGKVIICSPVFQLTQLSCLRKNRHRKKKSRCVAFDGLLDPPVSPLGAFFPGL